MTLSVHLIEGDIAAARLTRIAQIAGSGRVSPIVFSAADPERPYAPTDWLLGPGCGCCLPANHPRARLLHLGMSNNGPCRVVIDAGRPVLADRLASILRALPFRPRVNIITV